MRNLKILIGATAALATFGFANSASADIVGSRHDLTTATGSAFTTTADTGGDVCVFCHSPHTELPGARPLWNRLSPTGPFTMYSNTTIDMNIQASPEGVSLACLSCHDGTIAFDQLINATTTAIGTYDYDAAGTSRAYTWTAGTSMAGRGAPTEFGTDLRGDHPISIEYDPALDTQFNAAAGGFVGTLPLFPGTGTDQVECGTCHDPHQTANVPFLRVSNAASALCVTCHVK